MFNPAKELIARMGRGGGEEDGDVVPSESDSDWLIGLVRCFFLYKYKQNQYIIL